MVHFNFFENIDFSKRYHQKCVKKDQYTLFPNFEFEKKKINKNLVFSTKNVAKKFINSLINR
jgi:hypothetical protein